MSVVTFQELMGCARRDGYAVGYFESWSLESLMAVADAAEATRSPVILGFSGIYLPHQDRVAAEPLAAYAAMGHAVCDGLKVPACLLFNECPQLDWVMAAIDENFGLVMYADENTHGDVLSERIIRVCQMAHPRGVAVEAEMAPLVGVGGDLTPNSQDIPPVDLTDPQQANIFIETTGADALGVNIGQVHLHGRKTVRLDLQRLAALRQAVPVPLVLHGASSVDRRDLTEASTGGISKINVGSVLKQSYMNGMRTACDTLHEDANPYEIIGSGLEQDVLMAGRLALQATVEEFMHVFGSAGQANGMD